MVIEVISAKYFLELFILTGATLIMTTLFNLTETLNREQRGCEPCYDPINRRCKEIAHEKSQSIYDVAGLGVISHGPASRYSESDRQSYFNNISSRSSCGRVVCGIFRKDRLVAGAWINRSRVVDRLGCRHKTSFYSAVSLGSLEGQETNLRQTRASECMALGRAIRGLPHEHYCSLFHGSYFDTRIAISAG